MARGTTYGARDGPGSPSLAAILGLWGPPVAINTIIIFIITSLRTT